MVFVQLRGPDHDQVTVIVLVVDAVSLIVESLHNGELDVTVGVAGVWLTTTFVVPAMETQLAIVTVTE